MADIGAMVADLIAAGCTPEVAARVVAEAVVFGLASAPRPRTSADESADRRREKDRIRKQMARENPQKSADVGRNPQMSENAYTKEDIEKKEDLEKKEALAEARPRTNRGHRLPDEWQPAADDWTAAQRQIGADRARLELEKFRDHWKAQAGSKGVKLDWDATWRNWIRNVRPTPGSYPAKPLTQHQRDRQETQDILNDLQKYIDDSSNGSDADLGLLRLGPGDGQKIVHGGPGRDLVDLSARRGREGG